MSKSFGSLMRRELQRSSYYHPPLLSYRHIPLQA